MTNKVENKLELKDFSLGFLSGISIAMLIIIYKTFLI